MMKKTIFMVGFCGMILLKSLHLMSMESATNFDTVISLCLESIKTIDPTLRGAKDTYKEIINRLKTVDYTVKDCIGLLAQIKREEAIERLKSKYVGDDVLSYAKKVAKLVQENFDNNEDKDVEVITCDNALTINLVQKIQMLHTKNPLPGTMRFRVNNEINANFRTRVRSHMYPIKSDQRGLRWTVAVQKFGYTVDVNMDAVAHAEEETIDWQLEHLFLEQKDNLYFICCYILMNKLNTLAAKRQNQKILQQFNDENKQHWIKVKTYEADWQIALEDHARGTKIVVFLEKIGQQVAELADRIAWLKRVIGLQEAEAELGGNH